jgi:RNA polymerase sigma-70 factor (ECF subfamily)
MAEAPGTRPSLLVRIRDESDREAWRQFVDLYAPVIYSFARKRGLQDADAADLTQDVFRAVAGAIKSLEYDPRRGSFRGWLYTVARNKLNDFQDRQRRHWRGRGDSATQIFLENQPAPEEDSALWEQEYEQRLFAWAAEQIRGDFKDSTWQAFWKVAVEGLSGEQTAKALRMSVGAVYVAKSRVLARLKKQIEELQG